MRIRALLATLVVLAMSCTLDTRGLETGPDAGKQDHPGESSEDVFLEVDDPGPTTHWESLPLTGRGPSRGTLFWARDDGDIKTLSLPQGGAFCVDVPLRNNADNRISLRAVSQSGEYSLPVEVTIERRGTPPAPDEQEPDYVFDNIAEDATEFHGNVSVEEGDWAMLTDTDETDYVRLKNKGGFPNNPEDWFSIRLTQAASVEGFRFLSTQDCVLKKYEVHLSNESSNPGEPKSSSTSWTKVADISNGSVDKEFAPDVENTIAQWVGVVFKNGDCGAWPGPYSHKLREVEVWARLQVDSGTPDSGAPSCESGY